jgi:hypothetical protein
MLRKFYQIARKDKKNFLLIFRPKSGILGQHALICWGVYPISHSKRPANLQKELSSPLAATTSATAAAASRDLFAWNSLSSFVSV